MTQNDMFFELYNKRVELVDNLGEQIMLSAVSSQLRTGYAMRYMAYSAYLRNCSKAEIESSFTEEDFYANYDNTLLVYRNMPESECQRLAQESIDRWRQLKRELNAVMAEEASLYASA